MKPFDAAYPSPYTDPAVVAAYDAVAVRWQFAEPARDLVELLDVRSARALLDVGTGTGAVARAALPHLGPGTRLVGVDASLEMLRAARRHASYCLVTARIPRLPFHADTFDIVTASFVIPHVGAYEGALADMVRVCRPSGRIGMTAWRSASNAPVELWKSVAARYVPTEEQQLAADMAMPWDAWFGDPTHVARALEAAGLGGVRVVEREYVSSVPAGDFLLMRNWGVQGAVLRRLVGGERWREFEGDVTAAFRERFGDTVEQQRHVHFGIGTKPIG
jgi:SAM-dependent methyltransferase